MRKKINFLLILPLVLALPACNKYLDKPLPAGNINQQNAFISDNAVSAVVTGNFLNLVNGGIFGSGSGDMPCETGLYMDELQSLGTSSSNNVAFYGDAIQYNNVSTWTDTYSKLYDVNSTLEGIRNTTAVLYYKDQWLGECYFTRAFLYFYLTNFYGDVPLALTSDYTINDKLSRTLQAQVYQQIIADLWQAQALLNSSYTDAYGATTKHRNRPDRYTASALLSKVYCYTQRWDSAEIWADTVIAHSDYALVPTSQVFTLNNKEIIWSLAMASTNPSPIQYGLYYGGMPAPIPSGNSPLTYNVLVSMDTALVHAFEPNDNRYTNWVRLDSIAGAKPSITYYFPNKYTSSTSSGENDVVLRLAELYLIRAEARAHQNNIAGAQADLNAVRTRAGLPNTTAADQASLLAAVAKERRVELFTECCNRFFDLKRTGTIDSVMTVFAPQKHATWSHYMQLFPLPDNDLIQDPNLTPNPGYQQ
ncbi:RagB/SusD family nutrient uptake outer membrane protein [Puia dinghuensis]|uniref:Membrane protein n=1 Tax=Puia dinghuensis TaxID=1792502 RepID=A0A8J2UDG1_9BACT|nr:RagB/SusD family nutrient uptake outer membrane protein [Puia dinghuensis]GGB00909.1 membrane protein [Puia dinghuensis]